jgi:SAM-dependent methyltransferase/uncharacterized protein YbaR (Trm112 family)
LNRALFARLAPRCPLCRAAGRAAPLEITYVLAEDDGELREGILGCPEPSCQREFPVVDGVPLLFGDLCGVMSGQGHLLLERADLSAEMESLLGDAAGPGSAYDTARQHLSTYAESHWGDFAAPPDPLGEEASRTFRGVLERAFEIAPPPGGPCLDLGCALGRGSFEIAARGGGPVVGIDLHLGLLRHAARARAGSFHYPRRQVGLVYRRAEVVPAGRWRGGELDFWAADALKLPFSDATFAGLLSLNLIDCVASPWELLLEMRRVLAPGGIAWIATPWDWSSSRTAFPAWLGGHSQRGGSAGDSGEILRRLLRGDHPSALQGFEILGEEKRMPWRLRLHERSTVDYAVDLLVLRRTGALAGV